MLTCAQSCWEVSRCCHATWPVSYNYYHAGDQWVCLGARPQGKQLWKAAKDGFSCFERWQMDMCSSILQYPQGKYYYILKLYWHVALFSMQTTLSKRSLLPQIRASKMPSQHWSRCMWPGRKPQANLIMCSWFWHLRREWRSLINIINVLPNLTLISWPWVWFHLSRSSDISALQLEKCKRKLAGLQLQNDPSSAETSHAHL